MDRREPELQGVVAFRAWLQSYAPDGHEVEVVRTIPTVTGFVTEQTSVDRRDGKVITGRELCRIPPCTTLRRWRRSAVLTR